MTMQIVRLLKNRKSQTITENCSDKQASGLNKNDWGRSHLPPPVAILAQAILAQDIESIP